MQWKIKGKKFKMTTKDTELERVEALEMKELEIGMYAEELELVVAKNDFKSILWVASPACTTASKA